MCLDKRMQELTDKLHSKNEELSTLYNTITHQSEEIERIRKHAKSKIQEVGESYSALAEHSITLTEKLELAIELLAENGIDLENEYERQKTTHRLQ